MILEKHIKTYPYPGAIKNANNLVIFPHALLRPYIANYTFIKPQFILKEQTIFPTVSSSLVYAIDNNNIVSGLRGVNTRPSVIGAYARQFSFMFLIEFHTAGLYPFLQMDQHELLNNNFSFPDLDKTLDGEIEIAFLQSKDIPSFKGKLDTIFLSRLDDTGYRSTWVYAAQKIQKNKGIISSKELASDTFYSEKQLNRLFQKYIGTGVKTLARISRMKYALDLLSQPMDLSQISQMTGHYDTAHFAHDFKNIYGITPKEYKDNMSIFYNDPFKLNDYNTRI